MPRPPKPAALLRLEGKSHFGKTELDRREAAEEALKTGETFTELPGVADDEIAHAEFQRLKELFAGITYIDGLDTQIINRYCLEVSGLAAQRKLIDAIKRDIETADEEAHRTKLYEILNRANVGLAKIKDLLLKMEDRLFLTPAARIRAVPQTPPNPEKLTGIAAYLARRQVDDDDRMAEVLARADRRRAEKQCNELQNRKGM